MTIHYDHIGTNPDGTPHFHIWSDVPDAHIVMTGPIVGDVVLPDGTHVAVSEPFIEAESQEQAIFISDAIGHRHEAEGHPDFVNDPLVDNLGFKAVDFADAQALASTEG